MRSLKQFWPFCIAALALAAGAVFAQTLPTVVVNPKVLPKFPENLASRVPKPEPVKLANNVPGVAEPVLMPHPAPVPSPDCEGTKESSAVTLSFVVDADGNARNIMFKRAQGDQSDLLALKILSKSHFTPAMINGAAAAFGRDVEMHLDLCAERLPGSSITTTRLRAPQTEKFFNWKNAPDEANLAPLNMPADAIADGEQSGDASFVYPKNLPQGSMFNTQGMNGSFAFGLLIDEHGVGHIEKVLRSTNPALLPIAAAMILSIRRAPAMKDGMPVPMHMMVEGTL